MTEQQIRSVLQEYRPFSPSDEFRQAAHLQDAQEYQCLADGL